jgi:hypothetical protein
MTVYEYDFVALSLTDEQKQMVQMGLANIEQLNTMLRDTINQRAADGWEPLYPFSVPAIWFRRVKAKKTAKTA